MKKYIAVTLLSLSIAILSMCLGTNIDIDLSQTTEPTAEIQL